MDAKYDGFGPSLSLSLRLPDNQNPNPPPAPALPAAAGAPFPLNLLRSPLPFMQQHKSSSSTHDAIQSSNDRNAESRSLFRAIDMNQAITIADCDEKAMISSPNSTVSSVSGKRSCDREENDVGEKAASSSLEIDDDDDEDGGSGDAAAKKKLRLCKEQAAVLEETFREHNTLNLKQKLALANRLNLRPRQVEVWFQNRRARTKLKQTEVDCEYLRRCCENLTQENRRLQKEVSELRTLKLSPEFYMNMSPPTTLTMCPQCERVAVSSSSSSSTVVASTEATIRGQPAHRLPMLMSSLPAVVPSQPVDANRPRS